MTARKRQRQRSPAGENNLYSIAFDIDTVMLEEEFGIKRPTAYGAIGRLLSRRGFYPMQGSVYFSEDTVTPVICVLAAQELARELEWFAPCVKDIRMLRIEEDNDLMPAVESVLA